MLHMLSDQIYKLEVALGILYHGVTRSDFVIP